MFQYPKIKNIINIFLILTAFFTVSCKNNSTKPTDTTTTTDTTQTTEATTATDTTQIKSTEASTPLPPDNAAQVPPPQGIKYGYVNSLQLLSLMPETAAADKKLAAIAKQKEDDFAGLMNSYQTKLKDLQEKGKDLSPIEQEKRMQELQNLEATLQEMQMKSQDQLATEKEKLYAPILKKADNAIRKVGKDNGYMFIFEASSLLYADTTLNVYPLVKSKLK